MRKVFCTICCFTLISGCSWFADNRVVVKPKVDVTSPAFKEMLSNIINQRYKTVMMLRDIEADLAYREYLRGIE